MMLDEVQGEVDNSLWFEAYFHTLQRGRMQSVMAVAKGKGVGGHSFSTSKSILGGNQRRTHHLLYKTLLGTPTKGCVQERDRGAISHAITFLEDMAVCGPTFDAWDQFVWLASVAIPWATTQVEQYGYCRRNAIDLSAVMSAMEFRVTDEEGAYLCMAQALIFKGSILAYNPARDEVEWVPTHGATNDLSWAEERMVVALVNFVPHAPPKGRPHCGAWDPLPPGLD